MTPEHEIYSQTSATSSHALARSWDHLCGLRLTAWPSTPSRKGPEAAKPPAAESGVGAAAAGGELFAAFAPAAGHEGRSSANTVAARGNGDSARGCRVAPGIQPRRPAEAARKPAEDRDTLRTGAPPRSRVAAMRSAEPRASVKRAPGVRVRASAASPRLAGADEPAGPPAKIAAPEAMVGKPRTLRPG